MPQVRVDNADLRRKLRGTLTKLQAVESEIQELLGSDEEEDTKWWDRRCGMLVKVYNRGCVVSSEEWYRIGQSFHYDRRGLGGFFTGNEPSMVQIAGGRHALTPVGRRDAEEYLREHPELREGDGGTGHEDS